MSAFSLPKARQDVLHAGINNRSAVLLKQPAFLIVLGFATIVARLHEIVPGIRAVKPVMLVVIAVVIATAASRKGERRSIVPWDDQTFRLMIAYWAWMACTIPLSLLKGHSLEVVINLAPVMIFSTMIIVQPPSAFQLRYITRGYLLVCALFSVALIFKGTPVLDGDTIRYALGGSLDPNDSAAILAIGASVAFAIARQQGAGRWRVIASAILALLLAGLVRTGSRGGTIAAAAGLVVVALSSRGIRAVAALVMFVGVLTAVRQIAPPEILGRFAVIGNESDDYNLNSYGGRWQIWKRGVNYFLEDPVLGVGVEAFQTREGIQLEANSMRGKWSAAHNAYVQAFAELGFVGGFLFVGLMVVSIRRLAPVYRRRSSVTGMSHPEYVAAIVAFSVSAIFLSHAYFWGFFALMGLCALAARTLVAPETPNPAAAQMQRAGRG